jgi:hypothetical protein
MKVTRTIRMKAEDFPVTEWTGDIPPVYNVVAIKHDDQSKTLIALTDSFGGGVAWAIYESNIEVKGVEQELDQEDLEYLQRRHPDLQTAINALGGDSFHVTESRKTPSKPDGLQ